MDEALELAEDVSITHPTPWGPPYPATVTARDGTTFHVTVAEAAVPHVREVALLGHVTGQRATAELQGNTLTRAWTE